MAKPTGAKSIAPKNMKGDGKQSGRGRYIGDVPQYAREGQQSHCTIKCVQRTRTFTALGTASKEWYTIARALCK